MKFHLNVILSVKKIPCLIIETNFLIIGYGWRDPPREKPGSCPPANHGVRWPNIGWGKRWKDKDRPGNS